MLMLYREHLCGCSQRVVETILDQSNISRKVFLPKIEGRGMVPCEESKIWKTMPLWMTQTASTFCQWYRKHNLHKKRPPLRKGMTTSIAEKIWLQYVILQHRTFIYRGEGISSRHWHKRSVTSYRLAQEESPGGSMQWHHVWLEMLQFYAAFLLYQELKL